MTSLVMGDNLIMLYLGWEGVGLCSYLLIGYYYESPPPARRRRKRSSSTASATSVSASASCSSSWPSAPSATSARASDTHTGLLELATNTAGMSSIHQQALNWIPFLLMLGAFGKSAQFPLYVWLPDAMEGPTPVSALIHAATMVTAGVYMIARCGTLFVGNHAAMMTIAVVGASRRSSPRRSRCGSSI